MDEIRMLHDFKRQTGLSTAVMAKLIGISKQYLHEILAGNKVPGEKIREKIRFLCHRLSADGIFLPITVLPLKKCNNYTPYV